MNAISMSRFGTTPVRFGKSEPAGEALQKTLTALEGHQNENVRYQAAAIIKTYQLPQVRLNSLLKEYPSIQNKVQLLQLGIHVPFKATPDPLLQALAMQLQDSITH